MWHTPAHEVLHGQEVGAFLDAAYRGVAKREEVVQAQAEEKIRSDIEWRVAKRRSAITKMAAGTMKMLTQARERVKAQIRAPREQPFYLLKSAGESTVRLPWHDRGFSMTADAESARSFPGAGFTESHVKHLSYFDSKMRYDRHQPVCFPARGGERQLRYGMKPCTTEPVTQLCHPPVPSWL